MILLITGTPGTGKSTVAAVLKNKIEASFVGVNELVEDKHLYTGIDEDRGYKIVDLDAMCLELNRVVETSKEGDVLIVEGHLSHYFEGGDLVVVLRAKPSVLRERLKTKGWADSKIQENIEAEAIDICTFESYEIHGDNVNEIDTSDLKPEDVADLIIDVITGKKRFPAGNVDFLEDISL
jgi:adenylate kinase